MIGNFDREELAPLYTALARAQGEFPEIPKNRLATVRTDKGNYSYKYADLADVFKAVTPVLSAHGLCVMQHPDEGELVTVLAHGSGVFIETRHPIHFRGNGRMHPAQEWSAGLTFAKRYALTALLGVATEESVEGDHSARRKVTREDLGMDENFETGDGIRLPAGCKVAHDAPPRKKAEAAAEAIINQFQEPKTQVGVNGVWNRNQAFIDVLAEKHNDLYQSVFDAFHARMEGLEEEAAMKKDAAE